MKPVIFRDFAIDQIEEQIFYFEENAPNVVKMFEKDLRETISLIQSFPMIGYPGEIGNTRKMISTKFRYILVYSVSEHMIEILRVYFRGQSQTSGAVT